MNPPLKIHFQGRATPSTAPGNAFVGAVHKPTHPYKWIFWGGQGDDPPLKMNLQGRGVTRL